MTSFELSLSVHVSMETCKIYRRREHYLVGTTSGPEPILEYICSHFNQPQHREWRTGFEVECLGCLRQLTESPGRSQVAYPQSSSQCHIIAQHADITRARSSTQTSCPSRGLWMLVRGPVHRPLRLRRSVSDVPWDDSRIDLAARF